MKKIRQAIIMAAGRGVRMRPVTDHTPKPLIKVNGICIIESIIEAVKKNGIEDIYIVVGYLAEKFEYLKDKYGVELIKNPYYKTTNNISSLYVARDHLADCIITDGDILVYDPSIFNPEFNISGYSAVWTDNPTNEWILYEKNGIIESCNRNGGEKGWQLFSISRWSREDAEKLRKYVIEEFEQKKNHDIYWDDVVMFKKINNFKLGITPVTSDSFVEIDCFDELVKLDHSYARSNK